MLNIDMKKSVSLLPDKKPSPFIVYTCTPEYTGGRTRQHGVKNRWMFLSGKSVSDGKKTGRRFRCSLHTAVFDTLGVFDTPSISYAQHLYDMHILGGGQYLYW